MVVTLHACDTATDYALAKAVGCGAKVILSVPCCQHEVNLSIKKGGELDIFMGQGIIKERMCALLTDSIRAAVLAGMGYSVDMIEFIGAVVPFYKLGHRLVNMPCAERASEGKNQRTVIKS